MSKIKAKPAPSSVWPPPELTLPDTLEGIERERPEPTPQPFADSREQRLVRLVRTVPAVKLASAMGGPSRE